ncbi:MAG: hypothetical protein H9802_07390 [Candidatus Phocaeicola faecipullorum]|nr:hypothetical protein [Candidatus Phocaeicola faecipullorum]
MNTFFKSTVYAAFVGLTIFSSCSDEIKDFTVKPDGTEQGDGSATTAETKNLIINATATGKKWVVEDVIYVGSPSAAENEVTIDNQSSGFTKFTVSKIGEGATSASFEGEIPANLSGKKLLVFYGNAADMKVAASKVTLDLASQNGTLMSATADYTEEESINATFSVENASAELKIQTTDVSGLTEATLSFDESSAMGFTSSKEFTADGVGTYTMQKSMNAALTAGENNEYTISFIPTVSETPAKMNISLKATKESGDYTYKTKKEISSSSNYDVEIKSENVDNSLFGAGTEESPYIIDNVDKFMGMTETTDRFYQLSRDLDFTGIEFTPIATFAGTFDGNGMTISNLTFTVGDGNGGIFVENTSTIKNLNVADVTVTKTGSFASNNPSVGILTASNKGTIENCSTNNSSITATISNAGGIGILSGENSSNIRYCKVIGSSIIDINGSAQCFVGGLVGKCTGGEIIFSYVENADINHNITNMSGSAIGGLIGQCNISIEGCYAKASLYSGSSQTTSLGGFIGVSFNGNPLNIKGCFSTGDIEITGTSNNISGFIGNFTGNGKRDISYCYTTVDTKNKGGAFILSSSTKAECKNCYYTLSTGQTTTSPINGTEKVDAETLRGKSTNFNDALDWADYQFVAGTTDTEPLIIQKK